MFPQTERLEFYCKLYYVCARMNIHTQFFRVCIYLYLNSSHLKVWLPFHRCCGMLYSVLVNRRSADRNGSQSAMFN